MTRPSLGAPTASTRHDPFQTQRQFETALPTLHVGKKNLLQVRPQASPPTVLLIGRRKSPQQAETEKQAGHSLRWTANMGFQSQHKTRKIKRYLILFKQHIYIYNCVCACVCVWCKRRKALIMLSITTLPVIICLESMSTVFAIHNQRLKVLQPPVTPPAVEHKRLAQRSRRKNHGKTNSKTIGCIITAVTRTDTNKLAR